MSEPVTKDDVREIIHSMVEELAVIIKKGFDAVDEKFERVDKKFDEIDLKFNEVGQYIEQRTQELRDHFDAVAENIHKDVVGANQSEIELIQNKHEDHEGRIVRLEQKTGVR